MIVQGLVFKLFGLNIKGGPLGNGVKESMFNQGRLYKRPYKAGYVLMLDS
jgi:hypothetical protein